MTTRRLVWVDIGMAAAVGVFIAIVVFFRESASYVPLLLAFSIAFIVWAFVAEYALTRAETAARARQVHPATRAPRQPLPQ